MLTDPRETKSSVVAKLTVFAPRLTLKACRGDNVARASPLRQTRIVDPGARSAFGSDRNRGYTGCVELEFAMIGCSTRLIFSILTRGPQGEFFCRADPLITPKIFFAVSAVTRLACSLSLDTHAGHLVRARFAEKTWTTERVFQVK